VELFYVRISAVNSFRSSAINPTLIESPHRFTWPELYWIGSSSLTHGLKKLRGAGRQTSSRRNSKQERDAESADDARGEPAVDIFSRGAQIATL